MPLSLYSNKNEIQEMEAEASERTQVDANRRQHESLGKATVTFDGIEINNVLNE